MTNKIHTHQCAEHEVFSVEAAWKAQGYRLVNKASAADLLPKEYMKTSHRGNESTFQGSLVYTLYRRDA